ncbi:MAG: carboxypeptidase-like regulatory domain-containing protein [Rhodanobacteraceae bacterium]
MMLAAGVLGLAAPIMSRAQATSGSIVGHAPAGDIILIEGRGGMRRKTKVKDNGRYAVRALPLGVYMVTLIKDGNTMGTRFGVQLRPGASYKVDFPCKNDHCAKTDTSGAG